MPLFGLASFVAFGLFGCAYVDEALHKIGATQPSTEQPKESAAPAKTEKHEVSDVAHAKIPKRPDTFEPRSVVGSSEDEARNLLGQPTTVSNNPPAIVWHYASAECQVSLFFYNDVATNIFRVLTYKISPKAANESTCFAAIRKRRG